MAAVTNAIVGALILLALGWLKLDINRLSDRIDKLADAVISLTERVAHIEGRLDERERQ